MTYNLEKSAARARERRETMAEMAARIYALPPADRPYGQRGVYPKPPYYPKNANGLKPCRWCQTPTKRGWCGKECVAEFMRRGHWPTMAKFITKRDRVCQLCGGQRPNITDARPHFELEPAAAWSSSIDSWAAQSADARNGLPDRRPHACPVEYSFAVDHIIAVKDGGTDDPANLRLLCGRCHGEVTAAQHQRWARERRAASSAAAGQHAMEL